ncbi:MAG: EAL domain-containing protein [Kineosporiaceae bacterium]
MDRLFGPGMTIMRRLDVVWKLVLIAVVLTVPLAISVSAGLIETTHKITQAELEDRGLTYLRPLVRLDVDLALMHDGLMQGQAADPRSLSSFDVVVAVDAEVGREMGVHDEWSEIHSELARLGTVELAPEEAAAAVRSAMLRVQALIRAVSDASGLSLDTHLDTHYLVQALARDLPDLMWATVRVSQSRDRLAGWPEAMLRTPSAPVLDDMQQARGAGHQLLDRSRRMSDDLADAWAESPRTKTSMSSISGRLLDLSLDLGRTSAELGLPATVVEEVPGHPAPSAVSDSGRSTSSDVVVAARPLITVLDEALRGLLDLRAQALSRGRAQPLLTMLASLLVAGYLFGALLRSTSRDAQKILADINAVTGGPAPSGPQPLGRDEFARMSRAVEVTRDRLTSLLGALRYQATHDELTALGNRAFLAEKLEDALAVGGPQDQQVAVVLLDVVGFKDVNDSFGASVGDRLLRTVGARMHRAVRRRDVVARLGGDNFGILMPSVRGLEEVEEVLASVRAALADTVMLGGRRLRLEMNAGIAMGRPGTVSAVELLRNADVARYASKDAGRGATSLFEPWMHRRTTERAELSADLAHAVETGQLRLLYQPLVDLRTGRVYGAEALVRWQHPSRGVIMPDVFVPLAEATGQIGAITRWVLSEAATQARRWREEFPDTSPLSMDVNVSAAQLGDDGLVADVLSVIERTGIDPRHLVMEITESALVADLDVALSRLRQIAAIGIRIALDDFGTGYSSLSYLRQLPVSLVKIDKAFLRGAEDGQGRPAALVRSIIALGTSWASRPWPRASRTPRRRRSCGVGMPPRAGVPVLVAADRGRLHRGAAPVRCPRPLAPAQQRPARAHARGGGGRRDGGVGSGIFGGHVRGHPAAGGGRPRAPRPPADSRGAPPLRSSGAGGGRRPQPAQEQSLGQDRPPRVVQMQGLVGAVRAGVRVLHARDQHRRIGEDAMQRGDERDRPAHAHVHHPGAVPRVGKAGHGEVVDDAAALALETPARLPRLDPDPRAPRRVRRHVTFQGRLGGVRVPPGGDPHGVGDAHRRQQRVGRRGHRGHVHPRDRQGRTGPQPRGERAGAQQLDAVEHPRVGAQVGLGVVHVGVGCRFQAFDGDLPLGVPQRREQPHGCRHGVRHRPPVHARVQSVIERRDLDDAVDQAAQGRGEGGLPDPPVARVGDDDDVGRQLLPVGLEEALEGRGPDLLLALDEHRDRRSRAGSGIVQQRAQRQGVHDDARLVVGRPAPVQAFPPQRRLEGGGGPGVRVPGRLHVVVGVEQDARRPGRAGDVGEDGGRPTLDRDGAHVLDAGPAQQADDGVRAGGQDGVALRGAQLGRDARHGDQATEAFDGLGPPLAEESAQRVLPLPARSVVVVHVHAASCDRRSRPSLPPAPPPPPGGAARPPG